MTQPDEKPARQKLNVATLVFYVEKSPYLYDSEEPLYNVREVRHSRWEEIGALFGISGEDALRYWVKAVVRYKWVLRKIIAAYLDGIQIQADLVGPWFDVVGKLAGVSFGAIERNLRTDQSVEENFNQMFRLH